MMLPRCNSGDHRTWNVCDNCEGMTNTQRAEALAAIADAAIDEAEYTRGRDDA